MTMPPIWAFSPPASRSPGRASPASSPGLAPRLSVVLGQKLAAQAAPVIGAVTGAAINYVFTSYYQDMARVQFGLRRLAEESGEDRDALAGRLRAVVKG